MTASPPSDIAAGHNERGNALFAAGDHAAAIAQYRLALEQMPGSAELHFNLANALEATGETAAALASFHRAIAISPDLGPAYTNLGNLLRRLGRPAEALEAYRRAMHLAPFSPAARYNIGTALLDLNRAAEALPHFIRAADGAEPHIPAFASVGEVLIRLGRKAEALGWFRIALEHRPDDAAARFGTAVCLLAAGNFREGWPAFEARLTMPRAAPLPVEGRRLTPEDLGSIAGRHVVVVAEQGFGDTIQFSRYVTLLRGRGARVTLLVQAALARLLAGLADPVLALGQRPAAADFVCPLLSLPAIFAATEAAIPPPARLGRGGPRGLPGGAIRVGLAWSGNPAHLLDSQRSIPLAMLGPLLDLPGCAFHAIQTQIPPRDRPLPAALQWTGATFSDFADTADFIAGLDLVITVDTSLAHLAGTLGVPVWVLLAANADYRWMEGREDSPWYPSARLWRQGADGWAGVIERVRAALAAGAWR